MTVNDEWNTESFLFDDFGNIELDTRENFNTIVWNNKSNNCLSRSIVMRYAIWYHLYNLKNVKNTHGGMLLLVKLQAKILQLY